MMKTAIVVPARNEAKTIAGVVEQSKLYGKVIVVNDGSSDETGTVAKKTGALVLEHIVNLGKGAALKTGCDYAISNGARKIVLIDADGQHNPKLIPVFLDKLQKFGIVFGCRKLSDNMPLSKSIGNQFITLVTNILFGVSLSDTLSGYRGLTAETYKKIRWRASDYFVEAEMIAGVGKNKISYCEIPIETIYLDNYKGTTILDGMKIIINMLFWKLRG